MNKTYHVDGMTCQGCVRSLSNAIAQQVPEATVSVDLEAAAVTVDPADDAAVQRAVEAAGFTYRGPVV
jgi:copper chaperone